MKLGKRLRPGDWVRVRSAREIAATLDERGELDGMPMMPEMLAFVGQCFRVARHAEAACATDKVTAIRKLRNFVHLDDVRCDGAEHGSCQSNCLMFWHEAWLELRAAADLTTEPGLAEAEELRLQLSRATHAETLQSDDRQFRCQATQLWQATTPLAAWNLTQYVRQIWRNRLSVGHVVVSVVASLAQKLAVRLRGRPLRIAEGRRTPVGSLQLSVGELVEVRQRDEIEATLDQQGKNRGLWFDPQMAQHCGRQFRVAERIERIIDEGTGRLIELKTPTFTLDAIACNGCWHRFCSREAPLFWREIWLKRVDEFAEYAAPAGPHFNPAVAGSLGNAPTPVAVQD